MSRAVIYESFGGPEVLHLNDVPEPHAGLEEVRVRVAFTGLNPMDWYLASMPDVAQTFGVTLPSAFGYDFAGVVDEVGGDVGGFAVDDRVYGGILGGAAADYVVATPAAAGLRHTPEDMSDEVAATPDAPAALTQRHTVEPPHTRPATPDSARPSQPPVRDSDAGAHRWPRA